MKLLIVLNQIYSTGGGFNQACNAITQVIGHCSDIANITIATTYKENINKLKHIGINSFCYKITLRDKIFRRIVSIFPRKLIRQIRLLSSFEKICIDSDYDLVYFTSPDITAELLQNTNYIFTVWDLCHRDSPEFPEVKNWREFETREDLYRKCLPKAYFIVTDSNILNTKISHRYGIDLERLLAVPFCASPFLKEYESIEQNKTKVKNYLFYPGQYWAHKNHIRILQALKLYIENNLVPPNVVFAGLDMGAKKVLYKYACENNLLEYVTMFDFVTNEHVSSLYQNCKAVIMPTYFGPTNLPPLEAWHYRKPLIYSVLLKAQVNDAALLVDPDDEFSIYSAMLKLDDADCCKALVNAGIRELGLSAIQLDSSMVSFRNKIISYIKRSECWK